MKLFSFAFVFATLCTTAFVTAAPSSFAIKSQNFSFQEYGIENVISEIVEKFTAYWDHIRCISNVINNAVQNQDDYNELWAQAMSQIKRLIDVEWKNCSNVNHIVTQAICKADIIQKMAVIIEKFAKKLVDDQISLAIIIRDNIQSECYDNQSASVLTYNENEMYTVSFATHFECLTDVLASVSKENGLENLWAKTEPQLKYHLQKWKNCESIGNNLLLVLCNIREGSYSSIIASEYIKLAASEYPEFIRKFQVMYRQKCINNVSIQSNNDLNEIFTISHNDHNLNINLIEKLKCINEAIREGVQGTNFQTIWEKTKNVLEQVQKQIQACANESSSSALFKSVQKEINNIYSILHNFLSALKKAKHEAYTKIIECIKKNCVAKVHIE